MQTPRFDARWLLLCLVLASAVPFIDGTAVNIALPAIDRELGGDLASLQWIISGYTLTLASLLIVGGILGDRYGRRRMLVIGMVGFSVASLLCGLAPDFGWLIAGRLVQGAAAALLAPQPLAIIAALYREPASRGRAIGTWSGFGSVFTLIGPFLGGLLADSLGWRWIFVINPIILAPLIVLTLRVVPENVESEARPISWLPVGLLFAGLTAVTFAFIELPAIGATTGVLAAAVFGVVALVTWYITDGRSPHAMVPRNLLFQRNLAGANVVTLLVYQSITLFGISLTLFVQTAMGYAAVIAGFATIPIPLALILGSRRIGGLAGRYGPRWFIAGGTTLAASGCLAMLLIGPDSTIFAVMACSLLIAAGAVTFVAPVTQAALSSVSAEQSGAASGLNNFAARLASIFGIVLLGIISTAAFRPSLERRTADLLVDSTAAGIIGDAFRTNTLDPAGLAQLAEPLRQAVLAAYTDGFHAVMLAAAILAFAGGLIAVAVVRNPRHPAVAAAEPAPAIVT